MNIKRMPWPRISGWLSAVTLICGVLTSCNSEYEGAMPLPNGKYPLQLTAEMTQPQTRSGGKDTWTGGEEIGVMLEGMLGYKTYVMDASGNAVPKDAENTIYWKSTAEKRITACTPNPMESRVDISDQSNGYAAFDVMYASAMGRYDQAVNLRFNHRMAKVEVTLAASEGISEEDIEGATVTLLGDSEAYFSGGMVGTADQSDGEIKPYHNTETKRYEAVLVPQVMTGKPLIRIGIGTSVFTYTPDTDAAGNLKAGKRYAYNITVKASGIDVQTVNCSTWYKNDEYGDVNVVSKKIKQIFTADELKIGDYFYSDGTWSDGGLRKTYTDASTRTANPKPAPVLVNPATGTSRTVIGIVFQTDKSRIGTAEKSKLGERNVHGLVVAVKRATTNSKWGHEAVDLEIKNSMSKSDTYSDIDGLDNYTKGLARTAYIGQKGAYPAFEAIDAWNAAGSGHEAPANTTGWYLPSSGQWWDILQNLGGCSALADSGEQESTASGDFEWPGQGDVPAALNAWMAEITTDNKDVFGKDYFWSSSENSGYTAWAWGIGRNSGKSVVCYYFKKNEIDIEVRPVLAF